MKNLGRLHRLGETIPGVLPGTWALDRIQSIWTRLVGPALAERVRPMAIRRGILVLGCHDPAFLSSIRDSVEAVWPDLQARIQRLASLRLATVRVEPCDPPDPAPVQPAFEDAFAEVLKRYRSCAKEPLDSHRR